MWGSTRLVFLLCTMLCGAPGLMWAPAKDRSDHQEKGRIGMSASYEIHGDTTTVTINWEKSTAHDVLVVSLDSRLAATGRSYLVDPLATRLFGLVLARSAGVTGSATFSYKRSELLERWKDPDVVLSVYLTNRLNIEVANVTRYDELTSADCSDDFQILCKGSDSGVERIFFSNLRVFREQGTAGGKCRVSVPGVGNGHLHLDIVQ
jgi:hypothetical protein